MRIRNASMADLKNLAALEAACFPPSEAAAEEVIAARLWAYPSHFWLLEENGTLVSFIDGLVTDEAVIRDEMFEDAALHREGGVWQAVLGVNTLPSHRRRGYAAQVMRQVIRDARTQGRQGCVLTCKEALIPYYTRFGYRNEGVSASVHGGAVWYDMRLTF